MKARTVRTLAALIAMGSVDAARADCAVDNCVDVIVTSLSNQTDGIVSIGTTGNEANLAVCNANGAIALRQTHARFTEIYSALIAAGALHSLVVIYVKSTPGQICEAADVLIKF